MKVSGLGLKVSLIQMKTYSFYGRGSGRPIQGIHNTNRAEAIIHLQSCQGFVIGLYRLYGFGLHSPLGGKCCAPPRITFE